MDTFINWVIYIGWTLAIAQIILSSIAFYKIFKYKPQSKGKR